LRDPKVWRCDKNGEGHILGLTVKNGSGRRELLLYRNAIGDDVGEEVDVIAVVVGLVMDVRCSICGCVRTWVPGEEAIRRLLEKRGAKE